jgi:hypothetical protein
VTLSIDWIFNHLDHFTPFDDKDIYCPSRTKPFIELAIMFAVYAAATGDTASPAVQGAGQLFQAASKRADYTDWALRFPAELVNYAELCAAVHELGGDAGELRHRLQSAIDAGAPSQIERLPHRLLELRAALDWAGVRHSLPSTDDICAQTILGEAISAQLLPESTIYAITHVILFGSRFGLMQGALPEWLRSARVHSLLCDLLVVTGQARNWDLLGELLLCWDCIGFEHNLVTTAGWASFREAFRADGAVLPSPAKGVAGKARPDGTLAEHAEEASNFDLVYHTTLVAVLAGTVRLYRSRLDVSTASVSAENDRQKVSYLKPRATGYHSAIAPSPEGIAGIASAARAWLVSLLERVPVHGDAAVRALCHVLVASWIADTMAGNDRAKSAGFTEVAQHVARSLNASKNYDHIDCVKPNLKLLVELLLASEGLGVEPFRQFLIQSVSILRRADPVLEADLSLMDKRILLYNVGLLPRPSTVPADGVRELLEDFRLSASAEVIEALTLQLECLSGWGTQLVDADVVAPWLGNMLAGFAVQRLRNYDLISAARLLRLLEYLAASRIIARRDDLYSGLFIQHRKHGPFGWYGPEAARPRKLSSPLLEDMELYLPTTLECLWTLAEVSMGDWRLFDRVPPYALPED